jgi:hypothetical protein
MTSKEMGFWYWVVNNLMPKKLIYFTSMHVLGYATTGKYNTTIVPDITAMEAISRYGDDHDLWAAPR